MSSLIWQGGARLIHHPICGALSPSAQPFIKTSCLVPLKPNQFTQPFHFMTKQFQKTTQTLTKIKQASIYSKAQKNSHSIT
ncbi:hypothetical protein HNQ59_000888 [Chitinivorax tropicus]|uniref:Uncharacterized protein n=1 Tax=Chitinivorax tropicus TaxID=714531 RepID=A0A840MKD7_9PROT|nr:hypothetical protein [Chitinivorax tropicus]MBB5017619.1 hypothetical protein [Chitinivorax tropicus]